MPDTLPYAPGSGEKVEESEGRDYQVGLHHLDVEADTYDEGREQ